MKNLLIKAISFFTCFALSVSALICSASAYYEGKYEYIVNAFDLTKEQIAEAEVFIAANDRAGLYDYLRYEVDNVQPLADGGVQAKNRRLEFLATGFTDEYILDDDEAYDMIVKYFVYMIENYEEFPREWQKAPGDQPHYGDVNNDYRVTIVDVIMMNKITSGIISVENPQQAVLTDVDGNCRINYNDLTVLLQYVVNEIDSVPAEEYYW